MDDPATGLPHTLVVFSLDDRKYALPLSRVERVFRAAEPSPLPKAPEIVIGLLNVRGRIIPVVDPRIRLRLPKREIAPSDHFIIAQSSKRAIIMTADAVLGVIEKSAAEVIPSKDILSGLESVQGVVKLADGLILINDIDRFLSLDEEKALDEAMDGAGDQDR